MVDRDFFTDNVTGFFEVLEGEFDRATRIGAEVTLIFIKLIHLAEIGRNYGQSTAEVILKEINHLIRGNIRTADRGFIYGRDEVMIILPNTPKDGARQMITKLKLLIENSGFTSGSGVHITLRPRFGIASYPADMRGAGMAPDRTAGLIARREVTL